MAFNIGENIGAYRIIEQLGQGGMATVYKAYHAALDRYVALKVLHAVFTKTRPSPHVSNARRGWLPVWNTPTLFPSMTIPSTKRAPTW